MKNMRILALFVVTLAAWLVLASAAGAQKPTPQSPPPFTLVRLYYASQQELQKIVDEHDVWEVNAAQGYALAAVAPDTLNSLQKAGTRVEVNIKDALAHPSAGYPACYGGVNSLQAQMADLVNAYPALVEPVDYGASWLRLHPDARGAGDRLQALVLGNRAAPEGRPLLFLMANIHARELATPEVALAFARSLLQGYGTDADATWLLDTQRVVVIVTANPDGHRVAEQGYYQRKNANNTVGTCTNPPTTFNQSGVDLNRNHSYQWGLFGSASAPCSQTYRGVAPASEIETQSLQEFVAGLITSRRSDGVPMPADTPDLLISLHSYGEYVLWPWGYTQTPSTDDAGLGAIGRRFAAFNGYTAGPASTTLYDTSGDTTDWAYGVAGVPAYTFEVGTDFFQPCPDLPDILAKNVPALRYAARIARAPYSLTQGPDLTNVPANLGSVAAGAPVSVTAIVSATTALTPVAGGAEASIDQPTWTPGAGIGLAAADGAFDSATESVVGTLPTAGLTPGRHTVFLRGKDAAGHWGPVWATWLTVSGAGTGAISGEVVDAATGVPIAGAQVVAVPDATSALSAANGSFSVTVPNGPHTLRALAMGYASVQVAGNAPTAGLTLALTRLPCVLLVDADASGRAAASWTAALNALNQPYTLWRVADRSSPLLNTLRDYGIVVWIGGESGVLSEAQQAALESYLDGGGHLLLSGQRIAVPPGAPLSRFFAADLHVTSPGSASGQSLAGDDFLTGQSLSLTGGDHVAYSQSPSLFAPTNGAAVVARYPSGAVGGLAYGDDKRRLVVLGLALETVDGAATRQGLLRAMLRWLGCPGGCVLQGDVNRDGKVDAADMALVAALWPVTSSDGRYVRHRDVDGSGRIDVVDLGIISRDWGKTCPP
ncbi:MAG: M14 family zinc carboxypeptidase [Anaerolineae bacterium]